MKKVERFVDLDPSVEWEDRLLNALSAVLEDVPPEEAVHALAAFEGLGVMLYSTRLLTAKERLKDVSEEEK